MQFYVGKRVCRGIDPTPHASDKQLACRGHKPNLTAQIEVKSIVNGISTDKMDNSWSWLF